MSFKYKFVPVLVCGLLLSNGNPHAAETKGFGGASAVDGISADRRSVSIPTYVDRNNQALEFGVGFHERFLEPQDHTKLPIQLTVQNGANKALRQELVDGVYRFSAIAGWGFLLDVNTGEILALASVENKNISARWLSDDDGDSNRLTQGIYENAATSRLINIAMALENGKVNLDSKVNTKDVLTHGRFTIRDTVPQNRNLSVEEVFYHSSYIGSARIAEKTSVKDFWAFFEKMGQIDRLRIPSLTDTEPLYEKKRTRLSTLAISFGHGIATTPLQAGMATAALINGGRLINPTIIKLAHHSSNPEYKRVVSSITSDRIRHIFGRNAEIGDSKVIDIPGYEVGGISATSPMVVDGKYSYEKVITSFTSVFPMSEPKYLLMVMLNQPQGGAESNGSKSAPWNAGEISKRIIPQVAKTLGVSRQNITTKSGM
jgi:cell division protein FtsI (penicillin-binding protein 3)